MWTRCDAETAYLCELHIYLGKRSSQPSKNGLGYGVVRRPSQHVENEHYCLFLDNYFTSIPLMKDLQENGLCACGTVRNNRKCYPPTLKRPVKIMRGEHKTRQESGSNLTVTCWKDKNIINMPSTLSCPADFRDCQGKIGQDSVMVNQPHSVFIYNRYINGVNQLRIQYPVGRIQKKKICSVILHQLRHCECLHRLQRGIKRTH